MTTKQPEAIELYADSARGTTIPRHFIETCSSGWSGISSENAEILRGDESQDCYWDAWAEVLDNAEYTQDGKTWTLWQDGDLFCICDELMTDTEYADFFGEERTPA